MQSKTFRLFVSSTFSDFNQERRLLQTYVFPHIKQYCMDLNKGYTFQPIDLRWGVSNEAQLDQKALELCIEEVQSSKAQPHPNFLIMASNRYGWVPLPYDIEQKEFETILDKADDKDILEEWYILDNNQLPASYIIKQRSDEYEDYDTWVKVEDRLRDILQTAVDKTDLASSQKAKYFTSATEAESIEGIIKYLDKTPYQTKLLENDPRYDLIDESNVYGYIRDVKSIDDSVFEDSFLDEDSSKANEFKSKLKQSILDENILEVEAKLSNLSKDEINNSLDYTYEAIEKEEDSLFVQTMINYLKSTIDDYTTEELEEYEQEQFIEDRLKLFIGRENPLKAIQEYISNDNNQALVIYGPSGMGKSTLISKAITQTTQDKIFRFVGSTSTLNGSVKLLISILKEFGIEEQIQIIKDEMGQDKPEDLEKFYARINSRILNITKECVIFIDAIDQLTNEDTFIWLPSTLPSNLKIIITALDDEKYPKDSQYFTNIKQKTNNLHKLEAFENSEELLKSTLKQYNRTIQDHQLDYIQTIYKDINTPLYLSIAAQEMRHWRSTDPTKDQDPNGQDLATSQREIIIEYIENLTKLYHHDEEFVQRVLSYLYINNGLSESELIELISTDTEFVDKIAPSTYHTNTTKQLPIVIWARLHTKIKEFLKLSKQDGVDTIQFFYREFTDVLSSQDNKNIHEELIKLTQTLLQKYQHNNSNSNRWAKIYIELLVSHNRNYEDEDKLYIKPFLSHNRNYEDEDKLKEYSEFIASLDNNAYIDKLCRIINKVGLELQKSMNISEAIRYLSIKHSFTNILYAKDPSVWVKYYAGSLNNLAFSYKNTNRLDKVIELQQKALEIRKELYTKDPSVWAGAYTASLRNLASSYSKSNRVDEAIELGQKALEITEELYKKDPSVWAEAYTASLRNLASSYSESNRVDEAIEYSNRVDEAIELGQKALEITEELYAKDPSVWAEDYTISLNNLASSYKDSNRLDEAIELGQKALEITEELYKKDPSVWAEAYTASLYNLALSYKKSNRVDEAIKLYQKALEIREELYTKDPSIWVKYYTKSLNSLASSYKDSNRVDEAIGVEQKTLEITQELYTKDPSVWVVDYTISLMSLAGSYFKTNKVDEAIELHKKALEIREELYTKDPSVWAEAYTSSLNNLAISYYNSNRLDEAIELQQKALEITDVLYTKDPSVWAKGYAISLNNLAASYKNNNRLDKAIELEQKALEITDELYAKDPSVWAKAYAASLNILSSSYKKSNKVDEAIGLEKTLEIREELYANWVAAYTILNNLAGSYKKSNRVDEAISLYQKSLEITEELYTKNPSVWAEDYTRILTHLALLYKDSDRLDEAGEVAVKLLKIKLKLNLPKISVYIIVFVLIINSIYLYI